MAARFTQLVPDCADPERSEICVLAGHANPSPPGPERVTDRPTDAAVPAGDQRDFPIEPEQGIGCGHR